MPHLHERRAMLPFPRTLTVEVPGLAPVEPGALARVAVFRPRVLGDMLCAVPALRAIRAALPGSEISLIGLPWAAELAERLPHIDRFIEFPGFPGLPETIPDIAALPGFLQTMQAAPFDLLIQLYDGGRIVNPLLAACGARHLAGFVEPGGFCSDPALHAPWPAEGHEIERLLTLTDHLQMPRQGDALIFPLNDTDRVELASFWPDAYGTHRIAVVHPGAQGASRRWSPQSFAKVADSLTDQGCQVVLTGTAAEAVLVEEVQALMSSPSVSLAGRTVLWTLGAVIERASVLVCNDSGISHIAASLGTPSVVVSAGGDVSRWAPLNRERHVVLWGQSADEISVESVASAAHSLLEQQILLELEKQLAPETSTITGDLVV
jgi:ADP-heptose:LPS heptosyltransferase